MPEKTILLCIHGYGLRSEFWTRFQNAALAFFDEVHCPAIDYSSTSTGIMEIKELIQHYHTVNTGLPHRIFLLGHSLGGILAALALQSVKRDSVSRLVVLSSPYGMRKREMGKFLRFLVFRGLVPGFLIRPRFFGPKVSVLEQKMLFEKAVRESDTLKHEIRPNPWFHTGAFSPPRGRPLGKQALFVASKLDRIAPWQETEAFARENNSPFFVFESEEKIGHDDWGIHPPAISSLLNLLRERLLQQPEQEFLG